MAADISAYKNKQLYKDEYINQLHGYLTVPDPDILKGVSAALKDFNDFSATPVLIEYIKKNSYKKKTSDDMFRCLRLSINNPSIVYPAIVSDREKLIVEIENWWESNKDKNPDEWNSSSIAKLSHLLAGQANVWRPSYDISREFRLIRGELEDINDSPVMTVFKKFKTALLENDANTIKDCFSDGIGQEEARMLLKLRPKFREIADGLKQIDMISENEYKANYYLLGPEKDGIRNAFPVVFGRDETGNWKISQFYEYIKQNNFGK